MKVAVIAETDADEPRVAATPETVKKMVALGATVAVQARALASNPASSTKITPRRALRSGPSP